MNREIDIRKIERQLYISLQDKTDNKEHSRCYLIKKEDYSTSTFYSHSRDEWTKYPDKYDLLTYTEGQYMMRILVERDREIRTYLKLGRYYEFNNQLNPESKESLGTHVFSAFNRDED